MVKRHRPNPKALSDSTFTEHRVTVRQYGSFKEKTLRHIYCTQSNRVAVLAIVFIVQALVPPPPPPPPPPPAPNPAQK